MRKISFIIITLICNFVFGQNPEIKTNLPSIIPPSPTVAALMKFEEVPVSNYTGVPDISIPLFSTPTLSKDINLDISLKYHSGVGANDRSSDVGLGWSLFAGGTISRTVRGLPDEELYLTEPKKIGIYHDLIYSDKNRFYYFQQNLGNIPSDQIENVNEFLWETAEKGKYDSEHDLWQFNFMGFTGRFYIKKNARNQLEVKPLDDYRIKIINNYITVGNNNFVPVGFTIYDEKGYKYIFDVIETSNFKTVVSESWIKPGVPSRHYISPAKYYNSSFHLSRICDSNNKQLVEFFYSNNTVELFCNTTIISNDQYSIDLLNPIFACSVDDLDIENYQKIEPNDIVSNIMVSVNSKKIQSITVSGKAKIELVYQSGRQDNNILARLLSEIIIKNFNNNFIKKNKFDYVYSFVKEKRMLLSKVSEFDNNGLFINNYQLFYEQNDFTNGYIGTDYWGYFNKTSNCEMNQSKEVSPNYSTTDVLKKIKYPTNGCTIFDFEANTYSYIGDTAITDFQENPDNYILNSTESLGFGQHNNIMPLSISNVDRKTKFYPSISYPVAPDLPYKTFYIVELINGVWKPSTSAIAIGNGNLTCPSNNQSCCVTYILKSNIQYGIKRIVLNLGAFESDVISMEYYINNPNSIKYLYGGGNRIKKIGYFNYDAPVDFYKNITNTLSPSKEKKFEYGFFNDPLKSSGSLVFGKPLFKFVEQQSPCFGCQIVLPFLISYTTTTNFNSLHSIKTQGSDVGYKNVTVSETNNGKREYIFTSPIDYPEDNYNFYSPPFIVSKNIDYKRGLLLNENVFNNTNKKLQEISYIYDFSNYTDNTGLKVFYSKLSCAIGNRFSNYSFYKSYRNDFLNGIINPQGVPGNLCDCGTPLNYISYYNITEAFGWSKLISKNSKNYFYDANNNQRVVETTETYTYNPLNKKISEATVTNSLGDTLRTKYTYHTGNSIFSQNRISEIEKIESFKDNILLNTSKVVYSNSFVNNAAFLPQTIQNAKASQTPENRVTYNLYDEFSNPLEVQQESGVKTVYIYGYNQTQPIAKIENASYADVQSQVANLQTISNTGTEANLLIALNTLRNSLPNGMVTTYTYKPLVGVSTITDAKGDKIMYNYDSFGRLQNVTDKNGNILTENQYNYKQ